MRDDYSDFITFNDRVQETSAVKYLSGLNVVTDKVKAELLPEDSYIEGEVNFNDYTEYEFIGWYLDAEYTIPADADNMLVRVRVENGKVVPILHYIQHPDS